MKKTFFITSILASIVSLPILFRQGITVWNALIQPGGQVSILDLRFTGVFLIPLLILFVGIYFWRREKVKKVFWIIGFVLSVVFLAVETFLIYVVLTFSGF